MICSSLLKIQCPFPSLQMALNPSDLADLLSSHGYFVDYDTGEVDHYTHDIREDKTLLILLAAMGKLDVQYMDGEPSFYISDLAISDMELHTVNAFSSICTECHVPTPISVNWLSICGNEPQSLLSGEDRKSTRLNSSHSQQSRMPSSA